MPDQSKFLRLTIIALIVRRVHLARQENQAKKEQMATQEQTANRVPQALLEFQEHQGLKGPLELTESLGSQEKRAPPVFAKRSKCQRGHQDLQDHRARLVSMGRPASQEIQVRMDLRDHQEMLVKTESPDKQEHQGNQALLERPEVGEAVIIVHHRVQRPVIKLSSGKINYAS